MKLQLLVPQYKETEDTIKNLLNSIVVQQNIDFNDLGVIITNDGTNIHLSEDFLNSYPFKIEYYLAPHQGVSATRNYCLDHATADYVMFCDGDDMFYNCCGLWLIFREFEKGFDTFLSYFTEEGRDKDGNPFYVDHKQDATFVHGKVYRRQFLIDNNIRWCPALTVHEDSYFNYLCQACSGEGQIKLCSVPFYLWKWNPNSVSRNDKKYILKTFVKMIDSTTMLCRELVSRGLMKNAREIATNIVFDTYYLMNKDEWWEEENKEYWDNTILRFKLFFNEFEVLFLTIDETKKKEILKAQKMKKFDEGVTLEKITFNEWMKMVRETPLPTIE